MRDIKGYKDIDFNIESLTLIADLIYFDGPFLSHYASSQGDNYLFYWIDEDEQCNRWMIIKVNLQVIQDYISHKTTLYALIKDRVEKSVYIVDLDDELNVCNLCLANLNDLPDDYFPDEDSFYEFEPIDACDLNVLSKKYNQGIFELKITGAGVDYGTMPLEKLSTVISGFEGIRKTLADNFIKQKKLSIRNERNRLNNQPKTETILRQLESLQAEENTLALDTSYNTVYRAAGSFRIIFMPKNMQLQLWTEQSIANEFAEEMVGFIGAGENIELLKEYSHKYNSIIVRKLEDFVTGIKNNRLDVGITWYDDRLKQNIKYQIPLHKTSSIIDNLSKYDYNDVRTITMTGHFFMINIRSGKYSFEDDFDKSTGKFSDQVVDGAYSIIFNKSYKVTIERHTSQPVGQKEKIVDILISYLEVEDRVN